MDTLPAILTDQGADETRPEYAARVLRFALRFGPDTLDAAQLRAADHAAQLAVCRLPRDLDHAAGRLDAQLHRLRLRIAAKQAQDRARLAALQAQLDGLGSDTPPDPDAPTGPQDGQPPESETERAARLLRAGLIALMGPQPPGPNGGGRLAPLQPPPPTRPPQAQARKF